MPRLDTFGDIVLLQGFIESLLETLPTSNVTLLVREGYDQLAPLFPDRVSWLTTGLHQYLPESPDTKELQRLLDTLAAGNYDTLLVTAFNRTWIDELVAAWFPEGKRVVLGPDKPLAQRAVELHARLGLPATEVFDLKVPVAENLLETSKYQTLLDVLFESSIPLPTPRLSLPHVALMAATEILTSLSLSVGTYFACAVTCTSSLPFKSWPPDRFVEVMAWLWAEHGLRPLLLGHESESERVQAVAALAIERGIEPLVWLGKTGEMDVLAGLLKQSRFYFGNDTGPMHIAAALGVPTLGIFGGGHWPRFLPVGKRAVGIAGELPCFGCTWQCPFDDAPCVRLISVADVKEAISALMGADPLPEPFWPAGVKISDETREYVAKAWTVFCQKGKDLEACRRAMEHEIAVARLQLTKTALDQDAVIADLQNRLQHLESSLSWRLTAPLRRIGDWIRRFGARG